MNPFKQYEKSVFAAQKILGKAIIQEIQELLTIAKPDGDFYVCTSMGLCSLSAETFKVFYRDEPEAGILDETDAFDLGEKLRPESSYWQTVHCSAKSRRALLRVHDICGELIGRELMQLLPWRLWADKQEKYVYKP